MSKLLRNQGKQKENEGGFSARFSKETKRRQATSEARAWSARNRTKDFLPSEEGEVLIENPQEPSDSEEDMDYVLEETSRLMGAH